LFHSVPFSRLLLFLSIAFLSLAAFVRADQVQLSVPGAPYYEPFDFLHVKLHVPDVPPQWVMITADGAMLVRIDQPPAGELDVPLFVGGGPPQFLVGLPDNGTVVADVRDVRWVAKAASALSAEQNPWSDPDRVAEAMASWNPALPAAQRRQVALAAIAAALLIAATTLLGRRYRVLAVLAIVALLVAAGRAVLGESPGALIYSFRVALPSAAGSQKGHEGLEDVWLIAMGRRTQMLEIPSAVPPRPMPGSLDGQNVPAAVWKPNQSGGTAWTVHKLVLPDERWACVWRQPTNAAAWAPALAADADSVAVGLTKFLYQDDQIVRIAREQAQDGQWQTVVILGSP
jgi:hypothetical protein